MTLDVKALRELADGFRGRFFADAERGDIGYIAKQCDDKQCDCEVRANADGDQDCSRSIYDWEGEHHINEPIAQMLNAVGPLCDEVERLRAECHGRRFDPNLVAELAELRDRYEGCRANRREESATAIAERDALRARLAELDAFYAVTRGYTEGTPAEAFERSVKVEADLRAKLAGVEADLANTARGHAPFNGSETTRTLEEMERDTAEQIAAWLDGQSDSYGAGASRLAADIRAGAFRKEQGR